jgi:hypothetical protein
MVSGSSSQKATLQHSSAESFSDEMALVLFLKLASFRAFWNARAKIQYYRFLFTRSIFSARKHAGEGRAQTGTFLQLALTTLKQLVISVVVVTCLQIINPWLEALYARTGLTIEDDTYSTLLATVAATGGVLIGLYYAATTAIAGAIYSNVPNNIRDLLAQDRVGNIYMRFLSFITFSSIVLLGMRSAGFQPNLVAALLLLFGAGISIIAFVKLGARAFDLFDPTTLSVELIEQVQGSYLDTRPGQYRWDDPAFQNFAYRKARLAIDTTKTLAEITGRQAQLSGQPFATLCAHCLFLLSGYEAAKKSIPTDSRWYPRRYIHPDWYGTEDSKTSLAYQASGRLEPKQVSDDKWLESSILPITHACFRTNAEANRPDLVLGLVSRLDSYIRSLALEHEVKFAFEVIDGLTISCADLIFRPRPEGAALEPIEQIALADAIASMPITIFLHYAQAIKAAGRAKIVSSIEAIHWESKAEIYDLGLPRHIIPQLEWMYPRIDFEKRTEGFQISPNWYLSELAIQPHLQNLKDSLTACVENAQNIFDRWVTTAEAATLPWVRANMLAREAEYWSKIEYQFYVIRQQNDELNADRRIDGLPWPTIDLDGIEQRIKARKRVLLQRMAEDVTILSAIERPEAYPDFAGQFLHTVGENLIDAIADNDAEFVKEVFPSFFISSFMQYDRIGANATRLNWQTSFTVKVSVAPLLDLMSLSGYGFLVAEFHDNPSLSATISNTWNTFLDNRKADGKDLLPFLAAAISVTETAFEIAHRSMIRMQWGQRVAEVLRELPRRPIVNRGSFIVSRTVAAHKSPLVRVMASDQFMSPYNGIDIFIEELIRKRADGAAIKFGTRRDLSDAVRREIEREAARIDPDADDDGE